MKKERPILFSAPMVRAILEGRKTQTRRVVKDAMLQDSSAEFYDEEFLKMTAKCPFGTVGDRLWVKETFAIEGFDPVDQWNVFRADFPNDYTLNSGNKWKSSIFMPRRASRITLEITDIRLERLKDISEADAQLEGAEKGRCVGLGAIGETSYREGFFKIWFDINSLSADLDQFVWVISFKKIEQ